MASENTQCLIDIDSHEWFECENMTGQEMQIYEYCLKQGAKQNMGIFRESRFDIAKKLKVDQAVSYLFFEKFPEIIYFCGETHLIWAKNFYARIGLGLMSEIWKVEDKDGQTKKVKQLGVLSTKNKFIDKIKQTLKSPIPSKSGKMIFLKDHPVIPQWVSHNKFYLDCVNDDVKSVCGNNRNLDDILSLAKQL